MLIVVAWRCCTFVCDSSNNDHRPISQQHWWPVVVWDDSSQTHTNTLFEIRQLDVCEIVPLSCTCSQTICRFETFSIFKSTIQVCGIDRLHSLDGLCLGEFCVNGLEHWYCLWPWPLPSTPTNRLPQPVSPRLLVHHIFQVNQRSRANGPTRMAPSEGSQIESSQAKAAKRHFPNERYQDKDSKTKFPS